MATAYGVAAEDGTKFFSDFWEPKITSDTVIIPVSHYSIYAQIDIYHIT